MDFAQRRQLSTKQYVYRRRVAQTIGIVTLLLSYFAARSISFSTKKVYSEKKSIFFFIFIKLEIEHIYRISSREGNYVA